MSYNLSMCPYCGFCEKTKSKKWIFVLIIILLIIIPITSTNINSEEEKNNNENISIDTNISEINNNSENKKTDSQINTNNKNNIIHKEVAPQKTSYKINDNKYFKYLNEISEKIYNENNDMFGSCNTRGYSCTYYIITCYANQHYEENQIKERVYQIQKMLFDELIQNTYKKGSILKCNYDIVQLQLINKTENKYYPNYFKDFNVLELYKYSSFEDYIK